MEQDAVEDGELEVLHVDFVDAAANRYDYFLNTPRGRLSLNFAHDAPTDVMTGTKVRARGLRIGNALAVESASSLEVAKASALPNTLGAQRTLAILVNFADEATQPFTVAYAQTVMFTTTSNFDYEASYQQTWLTGNVAGWFTIASSYTTCDYNTIASQAKQAATAAGYTLSNYNRLVYVFPANACTWWGLGTIGGSPSQAWVNSKWGFTLPVIGHEMGHNFGLYHSHSMDCGAASYVSTGCTTSDYGDIFDMMGSSGQTPHFNAYQKERLGWLNAGVSPPIVSAAAVQGSATYAIAPTENARDSVPRAIKIPQSDACTSPQRWLYVESRQAKGFDAFVASNANVLTGLLVHQVTDGNGDSSYLLDMTPATTSWSDPALVAGASYVDPVRGVTIQPLSVGSTSSTVTVTMPAASCTHVAPSITLTPTATQWTSAGATVTYTATVKNNDGCGCASSSFDLTGVVPAGWSASGMRTAGINPGASGSGTVLITSNATAAAAFYGVTVKAANAAAPTSSASAGGTVAITAALNVSATTDKSVYTLPARNNQSYNASITSIVSSGGAPVAGASVTVTVSDPGGSVTTLTGTTNSAGSAVVGYQLRRRSATGTYRVSSKATMGSSIGSATTSFVVQ
jgi:hypothetical protein